LLDSENEKVSKRKGNEPEGILKNTNMRALNIWALSESP
jgi:hypothetical protein